MPLREPSRPRSFFDAAQRRRRRRDYVFVDADHAVFEPFRHPPDTPDVAGIEVAREAKFRGVHDLDRLLLGLEPKEGRNRSEGFLARYGDVRDDVEQKRRLEEISAEASPADREFGALWNRIRDMLRPSRPRRD